MLYVANSGGLNFPNVDSTVSVINPITQLEELYHASLPNTLEEVKELLSRVQDNRKSLDSFLGSDKKLLIIISRMVVFSLRKKGWVDVLKGDSRLVVTAAAQAQKAADFILDRRFDGESER